MWNKIFNQIIDKAFIKKPFNLKKIAFPVAPVAPPAQVEELPSNYYRQIIDYISSNPHAIAPDMVLDSQIYQDPNEFKFFAQKAKQILGEVGGQQFLKEEIVRQQQRQQQLEQTKPPELRQETVTPKQGPPENLSWKYLAEVYEKGGIPEIKNAVLFQTGQDENTADWIIRQSIEYALGEPKPGSRIDQRIHFFVKNPNKIPVDVYNTMEKPKTGSTEDIIAALKAAGNGSGEQKLLNELSNLISSKDKAVDKWVGYLVNWYGLKSVRTKMRDKAKQHGLGGEKEESMEGMLGEKDQELIRRLGDQPTKEEAELSHYLTRTFATKYIGGILNNVKDIANTVVETLETGSKSEQDKAERLEFYIDLVTDQLKNIFSNPEELPEEDRPRTRQTKGGLVYSNNNGSISIPLEIMADAYKIIGKISMEEEGIPLDELPVAKLDEYIQRYHELLKSKGENQFDWLPNWWKLAEWTGVQKRWVEIGEVKKDIKEISSRAKNPSIVQILGQPQISQKLDNLFRSYLDDPRELQNKKIRFIERTLQQDEKDINRFALSGVKTLKEKGGKEQQVYQRIDPNLPEEEKEKIRQKNKEMRRKIKEKGGIYLSKQQFETDINTFMPIIYKNKEEKKFSDPAVLSFLDIVRPHGGTLRGEPQTGWGKSVYKGEPVYDEEGKILTHTDMYYKLLGQGVPPSTALSISLSEAKKDEAVAAIKDNPSLTSGEKTKRLDDLKELWETTKQRIDKHKKYLQQNKQVNKIQAEINDLNNRHNKRRAEARRKLRKNMSEDEIGYLEQEDLEKRLFSLIPSGQQKLDKKEQKEIEENKELLNKVQKNILEHESSEDYIKGAGSSEDLFKIIYSKYLKANNTIVRLSNMRSKYNNIKLASANVNFVDDMIEKVIDDFKKIL